MHRAPSRNRAFRVLIYPAFTVPNRSCPIFEYNQNQNGRTEWDNPFNQYPVRKRLSVRSRRIVVRGPTAADFSPMAFASSWSEQRISRQRDVDGRFLLIPVSKRPSGDIGRNCRPARDVRGPIQADIVPEEVYHTGCIQQVIIMRASSAVTSSSQTALSLIAP